jgi:hypothetical protein
MYKHCCSDMARHLEGGEVAITFSPKFRRYGIRITGSDFAIQEIYYCPWCGSKLPRILADAWFEILDATIPDFDGFDDPRIPNEFKTDEWWLARGL